MEQDLSDFNLTEDKEPRSPDLTEAARLSIAAYQEISPEAERGYIERSKQTGLPVALLRSTDNRFLDSPPDVSKLTPDMQKLIAENPSAGIVWRKGLDKVDKAFEATYFAITPLAKRREKKIAQIKERGYTGDEVRDLIAEGYKRDADGRWYRDEEYGSSGSAWLDAFTASETGNIARKRTYYDHPVLDNWYMGPTELASSTVQRMLRKGESETSLQDMLNGVTPREVIRALATDLTVMRALQSTHGDAWRNYDDENLRYAVNQVGEQLGLQVEHIPLERFRARTFSNEYTDGYELFDLFGGVKFGRDKLAELFRWIDRNTGDGTLTEFTKKRLSHRNFTAEELEAAAKNPELAPRENVRALTEYLIEQHRGFRGKGTSANIAEGLMGTGKFLMEFAMLPGKNVTGGLIQRGARMLGVGKAIGGTAKRLFGGELTRLAYYAPFDIANAMDLEKQLSVSINALGEMNTALTEKGADELATAVVNRLIDRYIENVSERFGGVLEVPMLRKTLNLVPKKYRNAAVARALKNVYGKMSKSKWVEAYDAFVTKAGVSGALGEYAEEKFGDLLRAGSTLLSDFLNTETGDLGTRDVFHGLSNEIATFGQVALTSSLFHFPQTVQSVRNVEAVANFVDTQNGFKAAISDAEVAKDTPDMVREAYFQMERSGLVPGKAHIEPAKLRDILQSSENQVFMPATVGVTQEQIDNAETSGRMVTISLADAMAYLPQEVHSRLVNEATPVTSGALTSGASIQEALEKQSVEDRAKEQQDFMEAYDEALAKLAALNLPESRLRSAAKILGAWSPYLAQENGTTPAFWIRNVGFEIMKSEDWEEKFKQAMYQTAPAIPNGEVEAVRAKYEGTEHWMKAPNGVPTKLTESQWLAVRTSAFKNWFGDWESDPENASKIVDENGEPLVVYHGTRRDFDSFDMAAGKINNIVGDPDGAYFTPDRNVATNYANSRRDETGTTRKVIPVFLNVRNPVDASGEVAKNFRRKADKRVPYSEAKRKGYALFDPNVHDGYYVTSKAGVEIVAVKPEQIKHATQNVGTFSPENPNMYLQATDGTVKKGVTTFNPEIDTADINDTWQATITLFEGKADASTLVHEITHYIHRMLELLVESGLASERMVEDLAALKKWATMRPKDAKKGYDAYVANLKKSDPKAVPASFEVWQNIMYHEKIAEGFETFIMEGNIPKVELIGAFSHFKRLMLSVYTTADALGVNLSDEVRQVFRGMFASEATLQREDSLLEIVKAIDTGLLGLNQDDIKNMRKLINARNDQALAELEKAKAEQLKELRKIWANEARELMKDDPLYSAWLSIKKEGGLDFDVLVETVGEDFAKELRKLGLTTKKGEAGKNPEVFADQHGFATADDLIEAFLSNPTPPDFIKDYIAASEQKFHEEFPMTEAALSVQGTIDLLEAMAEKLHAARGKEGKALRLQELDYRAEQEVQERDVNWVMSDESLAKECKLQVSALNEALAKNDLDAAITALNHLRQSISLTKAKANAKRTIRHFLRTMSRGTKVSKGYLDGRYQDALRDLSNRLGFTKPRKEPLTATVSSVISGYNEQHPEGPVGLSAIAKEGTHNFGALSYGDVLPLVDLADFLYGEGRDLVSGAKEQLREAQKNLIASWCAELATHKFEFESGQNAVNALLQGTAAGSKLRNLVGWACKFDENSTLWKELYVPLMRASSYSMQLLNEPERKLTAALDALAKRGSSWNLASLDDIKLPEDLRRRDKRYRKWSAEMVLMACLNMGNAKNRQRLVDGYEWGNNGDTYCARIAGLLSKEDWGLVQQIWDAISAPELTSALQKTFRDIYHYDLRMEAPLPFTVQTSDGASVDVRGGYIPLMYAYRKHLETQLAVNDSETGDPLPEYRRPGLTYQRSVRLTDPLRLYATRDLITHIMDVAHYVSFAEVVRKLYPAVRSHKFQNEFSAKQGAPRYDALIKILNEVAAPGEWLKGQVGVIEKWLRSMSNAYALWGSLTTVVKQLASATVGANELQGYWTEAVFSFFRDFRGTMDGITSRSAFMRKRAITRELDFALQSESGFGSRVKQLMNDAKRWGYFPASVTDGIIAFPAWLAAYNKAISKGMEERDAVAEADEFVAKTQGGSRPIDLSTVQLNHFGRILTMFFSSASAAATTSTATIGKFLYGRTKGKDAVMPILCSTIAPVFLEAAIAWAMSGDDDDDDFWRGFTRSLLRSSASGFPVVGDLVDVAERKISGKSLFGRDTFKVSMLNAPNRIVGVAFDKIPRAFADGRPEDAVRHVADIVSIWYQIPFVKAWDRAEKIYNDWNDSTD